MKRRHAMTMVLALTVAASAAAGDGLFDFLNPKPDPSSGAAKEGKYTILLFVCRGGVMDHAQQARIYKENTEKHAGWKHLFVVHKKDHSLLFWGKYPTIEDAQKNLKTAKNYLTPRKIKVFTRALIVPVPGKQEAGPPEWDLKNTDPNWVHTVLIAEFHDVPDADYQGRQQFAIMYCRQLRKKGHLAFYRHGEISSVVTIGLFKKNAVTDSHKNGEFVRTIHDPNIPKLINRFPKLAINGRERQITIIDPKTKNLKPENRKYIKIAAPSYLTKIPREKGKDARKTKPGSPNRPGNRKPGQTSRNATGSRPPARSSGRTGRTRRD